MRNLSKVTLTVSNRVFDKDGISVINGAIFNDAALLSKHFANRNDGSCLLVKPKVLLINSDRCNSSSFIAHLLNECMVKSQPLVIVYNAIDPNALGQEILQGIHQGLKATIVTLKTGGKKLDETYHLLSKAFDTNIITDGNFEDVKSLIPSINDLWSLERVEATVDDVKFIGNFSDKSISELNDSLKSETDLEEKLKIQGKLNLLTGKNVEIQLAAETTPELLELRDKADDVIKHVKSALEEGIVPLSANTFVTLSQGLKSNIIFKTFEDVIYNNAGISIRNDFCGNVVNARTGDVEYAKLHGLMESVKMQKGILLTALSLVKVLSNTGVIINSVINDKSIYTEPNYDYQSIISEASSWLSSIIGSTIGVGGKFICFRDSDGRVQNTKDGVSIIRNLYHKDAYVNMIVQQIKHASISMVESSGDGTSSVIVIINAMIYELLKGSLTLSQLENDIKVIISKLESIKIDVKNGEDIFNIAMISGNGDERLAELIKRAYS